MKKLLLFLIILFVPLNVKEIDVTLNKCVDGDTAWFNYNDKKIKARFLAIDTPESTKEVEVYGKEASNYTCNELENAKNIRLEYDEKSDKKDKYNRDLVWVFVDDKLLQEKIIRNGYGNVAYLYGNYKYTNILKNAEEKAKNEKLNIWSDNKNHSYLLIIPLIIFIMFYILKEYRK